MKHWNEEKIVDAIKSGMPYKAIAIDFHINPTIIAAIKKRNNIIKKAK